MVQNLRIHGSKRVRAESIKAIRLCLVQPLCLTLAGIYLVLVSVATFCASSHDLQSAHSHSRSQNNISHSLLCSWACQVTSKANATEATKNALSPSLILLAWVIYGLTVFPTQAILTPLSARGPPK
jgi:hypothetical protein